MWYKNFKETKGKNTKGKIAKGKSAKGKSAKGITREKGQLYPISKSTILKIKRNAMLCIL